MHSESQIISLGNSTDSESQIISLGNSMDSESQLISLISQLLFFNDRYWKWTSKEISLVTQIISLVSSMDLKWQPDSDSEFMSLITQTISVFNSMDLDSQPKPLQDLISFVSRIVYSTDLDWKLEWDRDNPLYKTLNLKEEPEPELMSLIYQIFSFVISMNSKSGEFISLCPQVDVRLEDGKFLDDSWCYTDLPDQKKWDCIPREWLKFKFTGEDATYFWCRGCKGKNHEEYKKAPIEIKHNLHRKHSLQLAFLNYFETRECYCCDENIMKIFYYCSTCDFAINIACARKSPVLSIDHPTWHEHTLALFPRHASLTCNLCALADASSPIYMCPPCDFVVHLKCINLPRVIRISRHHHRISFTPSFGQGVLCCGVCRRNIEDDYGGYSCIKESCTYAVHSRCATQSNVWDGKDLEGEPEEDIGEVQPFVRICDGIIQHFSHQDHHLKLENMGRDYDENKVCRMCNTPIYFGNYYSCMKCDFILHEECANLFHKIHHPIHPHLLTLTLGYADVVETNNRCIACPWLCAAGFFYKCGEEGCRFKLHVQCASISEPLVHESHTHPLFLTSKPGEKQRICSVCKDPHHFIITTETFNCIECDFALCFTCATKPQKVRYKYDKHVLTLSYGEETSTMTYWCEVCEGKINPKKQFYVCDEYCCVTLHIECLIGQDLYMKPDTPWYYYEKKVHVLPNNHHMTRPFCSICEQRCLYKIFFQRSGSICCTVNCLYKLVRRK